MVENDVTQPVCAEHWNTFIRAWIERHGYNTPVTLDEMLALDGSDALNPCGDRRSLASTLRAASTVGSARFRRVRSGRLVRNPRGAAGYFYRPALWVLERVEQEATS